MHCYVLHPNSVDMKEVKAGKKSAFWSSMNYIFPKVSTSTLRYDTLPIGVCIHRCILIDTNVYKFIQAFHVSPFFEMDYIYDWTLWRPGKKIAISASLKRDGKNAFNAFVEVEKISLNPFVLFYYFVKFPAYCILVQVWIHVQALYLTIKGVEFIPHPEGSETIISQIIAASMTPYFALKERLSRAADDKTAKKTD